MKRILFAMSLSICMAATVNAQQEKMSMKSYGNEVRKDTIDTLEVKNERHKIFVCWFPPMPSFPGNILQFIRSHLVCQLVVRTRTLKGE